MTIQEAIDLIKQYKKCNNEEPKDCIGRRCEECENDYDQKELDKFFELLPDYLKCINEIATLYTKRRAFGEYPTSKEEYADETLKILEKYKIEIGDE